MKKGFMWKRVTAFLLMLALVLGEEVPSFALQGKQGGDVETIGDFFDIDVSNNDKLEDVSDDDKIQIVETEDEASDEYILQSTGASKFYGKIENLSVPYYPQKEAGDCGWSSIAMIEAYYNHKGKDYFSYFYDEVKKANEYEKKIYSVVSNGKYEDIPFNDSYESFYQELSKGNPILIRREPQSKQHWSVIVGYEGPTNELNADGFIVWDTARFEDEAHPEREYNNVSGFRRKSLSKWLDGAYLTRAKVRKTGIVHMDDFSSPADKVTFVNFHVNSAIEIGAICDLSGSVKTPKTISTVVFELDKKKVTLQGNKKYGISFTNSDLLDVSPQLLSVIGFYDLKITINYTDGSKEIKHNNFSLNKSKASTVANPCPIQSGKTYIIRSAYNNAVIEISDGKKDERTQLSGYEKYDQIAPWMTWTVKKKGDNFLFVNVATGLAMDIANKSIAPEAIVQQWRINEGEAQQFRIVGGENGKYGIINVYSNLAIDLCGKSNYHYLDQHAYNASSNQLWTFEEVTTSESTEEPKVDKIDMPLISGAHAMASSYDFGGSVSSKSRISKVVLAITKETGMSCVTVQSATVSGKNSYTVKWTQGDVSGINLSLLEEGDYYYNIAVLDSENKTITALSKKSLFSIYKKSSSQTQLPTESAMTALSDIGDTYATFKATLKNPSKLSMTETGIQLYDENINIIASATESVPKAYRYSSVLYSSYGTNASLTGVHLNKPLMPGTTYGYEIYTIVDGKKYSTGICWIKTTGSRKPATPSLSVEKTGYSVGDLINVYWNSVDYATKGYQVTLYSTSGDYVKTEITSQTNATFSTSASGYYQVEIVALGYENSDAGQLSETITVYPNKTVTFVEKLPDGTENVLKTETVKYGGTATAPQAPSRTGWTFQGWSTGYFNVKEDMVVEAVFKRNIYTVRFLNDNGTELPGSPQKVEYEGIAEAPVSPISSRAGYVFVGWDSNSFECVKENLVVNATYVYENPDLPIQLDVIDCVREDTGYEVHYNITNYNEKATRGRVIVLLKTSEGRLISTTESNAFYLGINGKRSNVEIFVPDSDNWDGTDAAYADVIVVSSFSSSIPISEKKTVVATRGWSDWSTNVPAAGSISESKVEYRYQDLSTTVSSSPSLSGWIHYNTTASWSSYGSWSDWSRTAYASSDYRYVETRTVTDQAAYTLKKYYYYKYYKKNVGWMYSYADRSNESTTSKQEYHELYTGYPWGDAYTFTYYNTDNGHNCYTCSPRHLYDVEYFYDGGYVTVPAVTHTEYRYCDRYLIYTYYFYKWSDWSGWSATPVYATDTRNVETRTVYRYKTSLSGQDVNAGQSYTYSGNVGAQHAGKQATLSVFKNEEPADYNNEYIGQTTIGSDGSWSFTFHVREPISALTGDYTVKLGIEGSSALLYVGTIEAPKPVYTVTFRDWDGEELSTMEVPEGGMAEAPTTPYRYGYRFLGWNTGLSNVHDNLEITAMYEREAHTVIFADQHRDSYIIETFYHGDGIVFPEYVEVEGYEFEGWFDEYDEEVTEVTRNMVVYAQYTIKAYEINFYDAENNILKTEYANYGETVIAPTVIAPEGQRFEGWSTYDYVAPSTDLDVYPIFAYNETTSNPVASLKSCTLDEPTSLTLSCKDEDATIFYSIDGTEPNIYSNVYEGPITIDRNVAIKFVAVADNKNYSEIMSEAYLMENAEDDSGALSIKKDKISILIGDEAPQITYFLFHENRDIGVQFYSLDESIVDVDSDGYLYANKIGTTQVFAITDDYRYADYCEVTVTSNEIPVSSLEITSDDIQMFVGDEGDLGTDIKPIDATHQEITWLTSDTNIVSVEDGHIVAMGSGIACITAQTKDGDNAAYCYVKVNKTTLELSDTNLVIASGQIYQLNATVRGIIQDVDWKSNNTNVVTVDSSGLLTAVGTGEATILVTANDGDYRTCNVIVTNGEVGANPPEAPTVSEITDSSVILNEQEGCEYSIGGKEWQSSPIFIGLEPETSYVFYSRVSATITLRASSASKGIVVTTSEPTIEVSDIPVYTYTGSAIKPIPVVTYKGEELVYNRDYKITYEKNTNASATAPKLTIKGYGHYSGTSVKKFVIEKKNIEDEDIVYTELMSKANNTVQRIKPVLTYGKVNLKEGTDYKLTYPDTATGSYKNPGVYSVVITGCGNYTGTKSIELVITSSNIIGKTTVTAPATVKYDGEVHNPTVKVKDKTKMLVQDVDYELSYPDASEGAYCMPGTYEILVKGIGSYIGSKKVSFKISPLSISGAVLGGFESSVTYTGSEITMDDLTVTIGDDTLANDEDYTVSYTKNTNAGKATMVVKGIGKYSGNIKKTFSITAYNILTDAEGKISVDTIPEVIEYAKGGSEPVYELSFDGTTLVAGTDYTVSYANNKTANGGSKIPKATITGKGNFAGKLSYTFTIVEQDISELNMVVSDVAYKNKKDAYKSTPTVYDLNGNKLVKGTDYEKTITYTYADGSKIGKYEIPEAGSEITVTVTGRGNYYGTLEETYRIAEKSISKVKYNKVKKNYTGREIVLRSEEIVLTDGKKVLVEGVDYEIVEDSFKRNTNPGTATVTVRGLGTYYGSLTIKYTINKKKLFG